jgi:hypothetical protein
VKAKIQKKKRDFNSPKVDGQAKKLGQSHSCPNSRPLPVDIRKEDAATICSYSRRHLFTEYFLVVRDDDVTNSNEMNIK